MQFDKASRHILEILSSELPEHLTYHSIQHTLDVVRVSELLAEREGLSESELPLLLTAACYHDAGFLTLTKGHEEESCRIAGTCLPEFGYGPKDISLICGMIRATRIPQTPLNHLEQIIADADLDYLGRDDFFTISERLYSEMINLGTIGNRAEWDMLQIEFISKHKYFTETANSLREVQKQANLRKIKARLSKSPI